MNNLMGGSEFFLYLDYTVNVKTSGDQVVGETYIGDTHASIQNAIDYVNSIGGGSVFIEAGTYTISSPIILYSNIEIFGEGNGTKLISNVDGSHPNAVLSAIGSLDNELYNIFIHDLFIGNIGTAVGYHGIYCNYVGTKPTAGLTTGSYSRYDLSSVGNSLSINVGIKIEDCYILYNLQSGIYFDIVGSGCIECNIIESNGYNGILLSSTNCCSVLQNQIYNNTNVGLNITSESEDNCVAVNMIRNNNNDGILIDSSSANNILRDNIVVKNNGVGINLSSSNKNIISSNFICNSAGNGISLSLSNNNSLSENITSSNGGNGISVGSSFKNSLLGNLVDYNDLAGIYLSLSDKNNITGHFVGDNKGHGISINNSNRNNISCNVSNVSNSVIIDANSINNNIAGNVTPYATTDNSGGNNINCNKVVYT